MYEFIADWCLFDVYRFYTEGFGMKLLRKRDIPEEKYSNAFLGFGPEESQFVVELTYSMSKPFHVDTSNFSRSYKIVFVVFKCALVGSNILETIKGEEYCLSLIHIIWLSKSIPLPQKIFMPYC